jgi:hypothetical protein
MTPEPSSVFALKTGNMRRAAATRTEIPIVRRDRDLASTPADGDGRT